MSNIDFNRATTAEQRAAAERELRGLAIKAECGERILSVVNEVAQQELGDAMSERTAILLLTGGDQDQATAASGLSHEDAMLLSAGRLWRENMRAECRSAIAEDRDPVWPNAPEGLAELADRF